MAFKFNPLTGKFDLVNSGTIMGALEQNQIAYGAEPADTIKGNRNFVYNETEKIFNLQFATGETLITGSMTSQTFGRSDGGNHNHLNIKDNSSTGGFKTIKKVTLDSFTFTGSGLDDMTIDSPYTGGQENITFTITIDGTPGGGAPDTFSWTDGTTTVSGVSITGSSQELSDGFAVIFGAIDGHLLGDFWTAVYTVTYGDVIQWSGFTDPIAILGDADGILDRTAVIVNMKASEQSITLKGGVIIKNRLETPASGDTITVLPEDYEIVIKPSGTIAALTIRLPDGVDGRQLKFCSTQQITALTFTHGTTSFAPTSIGAGDFWGFGYLLDDTTWHRNL